MVTRRTRAEIIPYIVDLLLARHCGKGLRDCNCNFCMAKRKGTYRLASAWLLQKEAMERFEGPGGPFPRSLDTIGDWIWHLRNYERRKLRKQLEELKNE